MQYKMRLYIARTKLALQIAKYILKGDNLALILESLQNTYIMASRLLFFNYMILASKHWSMETENNKTTVTFEL